MYKFITVNPIPAALGDILEADSFTNLNIRRETALALAAPDLLAAVEGLLSLHLPHHNEPAHVAARAAVAKTKS